MRNLFYLQAAAPFTVDLHPLAERRTNFRPATYLYGQGKETRDPLGCSSCITSHATFYL